MRWIHTYRLKGNNFWNLKSAWDASISWKRILGIREEFRHFFISEIGNGSDTFFWYDNWILDTPLCTRVTPRAIASMAFDCRAKVSDFVVNGQVSFPEGLLLLWPELRGKIVSVNEHRKDKILWRSCNGKKTRFKSSTVWNDFRVAHPRVEWCNIVWFSNSIPKHSFILWLAVRGKLLTQDRM